MFIHVLKPKLTYRTLKDSPEYEVVVIRARRILVHRLVALAFIGSRPEGFEVNHKDHNKRNNRPENLEYVSRSENIKQAYRAGRIGLKFKLNAFQQAKVIELYQTGKFSTCQLARQFGVSDDSIRYLLKLALVPLHRMKKLTPAIYEEIREKWIPFKYPASRLAREYGVSIGLIEAILGQRSFGRGKPKLPSPRTGNHPIEFKSQSKEEAQQ